MSDGGANDDVLHINNVLPGLAGAACTLTHRRQHRAWMNSSVKRQRGGKRIKKNGEQQEMREEPENEELRKGAMKRMTPIKECENQWERNPCKKSDRNR